MLIVGLTGSIGMGKSTASGCFLARGIPVFDADAEVHDLYRSEAVAAVEHAFPGTTGENGVDRERLSRVLAGRPDRYRELEAIVHPLVRRREKMFLDSCNDKGAAIAVLDVPLLFETQLDGKVDVVVVVSASRETQRQRVLERPGMTPEKLDDLLARQMGDGEKRQRAHFVVDTNGPIEGCCRQVDAITRALAGRTPRAYARYWQPAD